jgi:phenylalanyl-tRNA synthetase alpha chain
MKDQILDLEKKAFQELGAIRDLEALEKFRIAYLGKKGSITACMKQLAQLTSEERPEVGKLANQVKTNLTRRYEEARGNLSSEKGEDWSLLDVTLPGRRPARGHIHPITKVWQ